MEWIYLFGAKIIALIGAVTGLILGSRKAWKDVVKPTLLVLREKEDRNVRIDMSLSTIASNQERMGAAIEKHGTQIEYIQKELRPNGGGSIFDKVTTMSHNISFMLVRGDAMIALSHSPIYECDGRGMCTNVNARYRELTGLSTDEAYGVGWLNAIHPDDRRKVQKQWNEAVENSREFHSIYRLVSKDGKVMNVSGSAKIARDPKSNSISHIMGTLEVLSA